MKYSLLGTLSAAALALAVPAVTLAAEVAIANSGVVSAPSCPSSPCSVISRTTAIQIKDGGDVDPFKIRRGGSIRSWWVTLAIPSTDEIHYFDTHEGGTARAALAVLRNVGGLDYKLVALSSIVHLQPDFGKTAQLRLTNPIRVVKGDVVALAVPTWLPALSLAYPATTSWRASRSAAQCSDVAIQTMQSLVGSSAGYDCLYPNALITYGASESTSRP
ncbi:MAG TPA: hypothetical protein VHM72_10320 [Solirubrobacteraceae bacterium]|nr:hypothetical protein [Solirubrobacteraceae bacterium]